MFRPDVAPPEAGALALPVHAVEVATGVLQVSQRDEWVAEEVPVALVCNGVAHAVMLASPLALEDFALGFALSEGLIETAADLLDIEVRAVALPVTAAPSGQPGLQGLQGLELHLQLTQRCFARLKDRRRSLAGRTGCGLCGTQSLSDAVRPVLRQVSPPALRLGTLMQAMQTFGAAQGLRAATGATHAAGWFTLDGRLACLREDVGRHNALDKLIGWLARSGTDAAGGFAGVTSRASYEMVHKAATAGIGVLAAVSAPTALAVRTADAAGLVLAGYTRGSRTTLYSHAGRLLAD